MTSNFNRRQALALGSGAISVAVLGVSSNPAQAKNDADEAIKKFTGGKTPVQGKVKLDLPEIAENGNTVPMTVTVESPMTEQSHVTEVLIVADENPRSGIVTFHFLPATVQVNLFRILRGTVWPAASLRWPVSMTCETSAFTSTMSPFLASFLSSLMRGLTAIGVS